MHRLWLTRLLIIVVIAWNLQAALAFLLAPAIFAPAFELSGIPGQAAVRGFAVLFVMWNVPYLLAAWHPNRYLLSLKEAVLMQAIGIMGETGILFSINAGHPALRASILRFISFDATGLVLLLLALWLAMNQIHRQESR